MKLPIGIQSFANLRNNEYLYVDKTQMIYRLISDGRFFFLSRPRRFGKSLLLSTFNALFNGKKELFEGLFLYDRYDWNEQFPVIKLDWSGIKHSSPEEMEQGVSIYLKQIAEEFDIRLEQQYAANRFEELIRMLHRKTARQIVVLVDEYDMPILDALNGHVEKIGQIRDFLQSFYKVLKAADEHLRFVFLTGVSKFSKVSVFSGLNNIRDITLSAEYATLCGYTQEELEFYFEPWIKQFAERQKSIREDLLRTVRYWYNGFSWDGINSVYNPFSTLLLFTEQVIRNYWFETGTPAFLVSLIKERNDVKTLLEPVQIQDSSFNSFDFETLDTKLILFQTGYLTIKDVNRDPLDGRQIYTLGIPNEEVRRSLLEHLVSSFAYYPLTDTPMMRNRMLRELLDGNISAFETEVKELFARIPYHLHIPREAYYHSLLLLWLNLLGFELEAEVSTDKGRIDAVWTWEDQVIIAELKYSDNGAPEPLLKEAMVQIRERRYYERYAGGGRRIRLLAIAFAGKETACSMAEL
jgi:hypothetical protein